ncbi:methylenetetrahydrofolate reductase [Arenicella chitinivorans]|uniref:Methylenetetrahydrofolate reductase n=1 Tax=Arenicella chitinivorans TaxID=1329800 RepID=A0A918RW36_9GAMM|nr:methylenetetrahydrofolate reductase [NAD(P)H] [Arenicella chitinivorans]GHA14737.1 methylenetetrahydrofolate reductase [Arenicella chitinivorans]
MSKTPELSFEFFPPRTEKGVATLNRVHAELARFEPTFFSVTFGAGGSTQDGTYDAVKHMINAGSDAAPHISCVGASKPVIKSMVEGYLALGVKRLVVLRGDLPSGMVERGDFAYANELVSFIRQEFGDDLHLEVAAYPDFHPESRSPQRDLENFKRKVDAGANSALTQYFYNADSYFAYVDEAQRLGVTVPIIPGIMPITNYATLVRFSDACGAELPRWIRARLEQYQDDEASLKAFGLDVVTHLCFDLLDNGVEGLHFYALNKVEPVKEICTRIGYQLTA